MNRRLVARHWPLSSPQNAWRRTTLSPCPARLAGVAARSNSRARGSRRAIPPDHRHAPCRPRRGRCNATRDRATCPLPAAPRTPPSASRGDIGPARARHNRRRLRKGHARFADPVVYGADAGPEEGFERAESRHAHPGEVDIGSQHGGKGRQIRRDRLLASGLQEIGAADVCKPRAVFSQHLQPHRRRGGIAQPEFENRHHPEIATERQGAPPPPRPHP